jgi:hypothetical protein
VAHGQRRRYAALKGFSLHRGPGTQRSRRCPWILLESYYDYIGGNSTPRIMSTTRPIAHAQMIAFRACGPLRPDARGAFLEAVAAALQGCEIGDGSVGRAIAQAQRKFFDPPLSTDERSEPHRRAVAR